jgi:hypothetical protein
LALKPRPDIFELPQITEEKDSHALPKSAVSNQEPTELSESTVEKGKSVKDSDDDSNTRAIHLVQERMGDPTSRLLYLMRRSLESCHAVLMDLSGHRRELGPGQEISSDVSSPLDHLRKAMARFDAAETDLLDGHELPASFIHKVVEMFAYCRPIRQAASAVEAVLVKVVDMERRKSSSHKLYPPSYPWRKALNRTNAQVRHDRGGVTAG